MLMKSIKSYIGLVLIGVLGLFGCKDDVLVNDNRDNVKAGIPVQISVNFSTVLEKVQSRVVQEPETEYNVSNIYLFAFNERGEKTGGQSFTVGEDATGSYGNESFTGTISGFKVLTGTEQKLYAIANYDSGDFDLSKEILDAIETESALQELSIGIRNNRVLLNRLSFVMVGEEKDVTISENNGVGTITSSDGGNVDIELQRLDSKITFNVTANIDEAISGTLKFIPKSYLIKNIPVNVPVVNRQENLQDATYVSMNEDSENEDEAPVTVFEEVSEIGCTFNFYMLENYTAPPAKGEAGTEGSGLWIDETEKNKSENANVRNLYALREKENKKAATDPNRPGMTEENTGYKYAPSTATCVIIKGELSYERNNPETGTEYVNVSAEYTVHLGETGDANDANNEAKVNNYTVDRNAHYIYNITLTGIDSYDAEVNKKQEVRPGVEGDVIIAGDQVRAVDSHYFRTRIKFTRKALQEGLSWIIQTPFDQGMKLSTSNENNLKDYKWVLFAVNREFGISASGTNTMVKFPGYFAYDGGAPTTQGTQTNANSDEGNSADNVLQHGDWKNNIPRGNFYANTRNLSDDACLRDVNQLINHLEQIAQNDDAWNRIAEYDSESRENVVYVTAFIDEYVYIYDPTGKTGEAQEYTIPDEGITDSRRLKLWKEVVNGTDRLMHICTSGAIYSPDGESSWSNSVLTIRQMPIYSIYNERNADISSAWGTESILETNALPVIPDNSYSVEHGSGMTLTLDNGRYNTLSVFGDMNNGRYQSNNIGWTTVLSRDADNIGTGEEQNDYELQPRYRDVWHACMIRNRDLDGDNVIDPEEIRWVLASIDELTDLWIGEDALPQVAHLYQGNGTYEEHVISSSGDYTSPWIIWAEEGASRGKYNDGSYTDHETHARDYKYRCIRYLGISLDDIEATPEDYVTVTRGSVPSNYGPSYQLDLSKLDYSARRQSFRANRELPRHTERDAGENNKPYRSFEVLVNPQGEGATGRRWNYDSEHDSNYGNPEGFEEMMNYGNVSRLCPSGYRVPNQRELMLMYTSLNNSKTYPGIGNIDDVQWSDNYWSATQFSYNQEGIYAGADERPGFATNAQNMILTSTVWNWSQENRDYTPRADNVTAKVRCVRDIE